ncbi:MAG: OmpA family protein [Polyangiaceae bacterium]|nr:OmpA family protein [Polyangiaceae bacterium]
MRARARSTWLCGGAVALALVAGQGPAAAQGLALDRFNPAPAGDRMFSVPSPYVAGDMALHAMVLADYAHNPLVLRRESSGDDVGSVVSSQLFLHLNATLALWDRVGVDVDVPFAVYQAGDDPQGDGVAFASPSSAEIGDLRLGLRLRLLGEYFDPFQLAVGGYVWVPTGNGDAGSFVGEGSVRGLPMLIAGGRLDWMVWSASAGVDIRRSQDFASTSQGTQLQGGAGVGFLLGEERRFQIGPELSGGLVLSDVNKRTSNGELLISARYRFLDDLEAGLGAGSGLTSGVGTPDFRGVAMIAYTPEVKPPVGDRDHDGIKDDADACPDVKGVASEDPKKHGCPPPPPPPDRDKDGILDSADACPDVAGVASEDPAKHGCPQDRDGDGVIDAEDACPDIPGKKTQDPATNGCPGDRDGDTIRDDQDACPDEKGKPDPDPKKNGCPVAVRVTEKEIVILQQVQFDTAKATIKKVSDPLLDEVAGVLKEHPEITKIEVQGHTDNRGPARLNEKLSQDRADAVMAALVKRGVDQGRLTAKGYGPNVPIADNKTDEGRQKNRRVQFNILEKKAKP